MQIDGEKMETMADFIFLGSNIIEDGDCGHKIKKHLLLLRKASLSYDKPRQHIKKQRYHFADKDLYSQSYGFSSSHIQMWEQTVKNAESGRTDAFELMLEKTLESPLDGTEVKPINPQ